MKSCNVAIIGAGPAGCACAYFASQNNNITLFDFKSPLHTLLYTGGGRCNLAYAQYDFKELAKNYPRGEKFLYSVLSRFSTYDTINFFEKIGVNTYIQDDLRIFPVSNSALEVKNAILNALSERSFIKEKVLEICPLTPSASPQSREGEKTKNKFTIITDKNTYEFDKVVIAVGGHASFELAKNLGHRIIKPKPALTGLISKENFKMLQGVSLRAVSAEVIQSEVKQPVKFVDDLLFTHEGISGPLAYKISSVFAREDYDLNNPLIIRLNFLDKSKTINLADFQNLLNANPKKDIKNIICDFVPKAIGGYILDKNNIPLDAKCHQIDGKTRDLILKSLTEFEINVISPSKEGEVVTSGGVCLDEINPKTMESKLVEGLYFAGEVIDVDGFCGGFNLQNCWSTGFVAGSSL